ncbi:MAG: hypothetical protein ABII90_07740, partial [Bacteroidota bacterium]
MKRKNSFYNLCIILILCFCYNHNYAQNDSVRIKRHGLKAGTNYLPHHYFQYYDPFMMGYDFGYRYFFKSSAIRAGIIYNRRKEYWRKKIFLLPSIGYERYLNIGKNNGRLRMIYGMEGVLYYWIDNYLMSNGVEYTDKENLIGLAPILGLEYEIIKGRLSVLSEI